MIPDIDGAAEEFAAFRVRSGDEKVFGSHNIPLESCGDESIDVFGNGDKHFAGKMAAFFASMKLVLEMDSSGPVFGKEFGQFQYCRKASVPIWKIVKTRSEFQW